jgi:hypothetical protein
MRRGLLVHVTSLCNGDDEDGDGLVVDCVDHAKIADAITIRAGERTFQGLTLLPALG